MSRKDWAALPTIRVTVKTAHGDDDDALLRDHERDGRDGDVEEVARRLVVHDREFGRDPPAV